MNRIGKTVSVEDLFGKTVTSIKNEEDRKLIFTCDDGTVYQMHHRQN